MGLYRIKLLFLYIPRNCDAEFSQIFTGNVFNRLSSEERLLFETSYSVEGTCLQCSKNNQRSSNFIVSYISEIGVSNSNDLRTDWPHILSPNINDTTIQCTDCESLINANLTSFQVSQFRFIEFDSNLTSVYRFHIEIFVQGHRYLLKAMVRHLGAHFTCTVGKS